MKQQVKVETFIMSNYGLRYGLKWLIVSTESNEDYIVGLSFDFGGIASVVNQKEIVLSCNRDRTCNRDL